MKIDIVCADCGISVPNQDSRRKYCDGCRKAHRRVSQTPFNDKRNIETRSKRQFSLKIPKSLTDYEKVDWYLDNRTVRSGDCILWTGGKTKEGYGRSGFKPDTVQRTTLAHRFFYFIQVRETVEPLHHTCGNTSCVNVDHLVPTSQAENTLEMLTRRGFQARIEELEARIFELENPEIGMVT